MVTKQNNDASYELFRELLDSKFSNLEQKIDSNHALQTEISTNILNQATKTNGRVTKLEDRTTKLEVSDITHSINCPRISEIKEINAKIDLQNGEMTEMRLIKKYPKTTVVVVASLVLYLVFSFGYGAYNVYESFIKPNITAIK